MADASERRGALLIIKVGGWEWVTYFVTSDGELNFTNGFGPFKSDFTTFDEVIAFYGEDCEVIVRRGDGNVSEVTI